MNYELPIADFLQLLLTYVQERKTGSIAFFAEGAWGKLIMHQGEILSIRFKELQGSKALPSLKELNQIQYHFRPEEQKSTAPPRDSDLDTTSFLRYFGLDLTQPLLDIPERAAVAGSLPTRSGAPSQAKYGKILIADDSGIARKALSRILIEAGYQVVEARNGFETLGQLENERPDLLFLDLVMPGIDGYKVLKMIERASQDADATRQRIPVIVLTSRDGLLDKLKGMTLKCDAYLTKPVPADALLEMVNRYLPSA
jgi:CheY-like chemotaxis protein